MRTQVRLGGRVRGGVVLAAGVLVFAGAGCGSEPASPPEQTASQSSADMTPSCPVIEVGPSGRATQRFTLGGATLALTMDPRKGESSSRIEIGQSLFSETHFVFDDFDQDGVAMAQHLGQRFFGDDHDVWSLTDDSITLGTVDGRPTAPVSSDDQQVTFLDGSLLPAWAVDESIESQVNAIEGVERACAASPDLVIHRGPRLFVCEPQVFDCIVALLACDASFCPGPACTILNARLCGKQYGACLQAIPDVGGGCCDATKPTTACCDQSLCIAGSPSGVSCDGANAGHCSNCHVPYAINGCTTDADCCPAVPNLNSAPVPFHCRASGNGPSPSGPKCCRPAQYGDPCMSVADCPGAPNDVCCNFVTANGSTTCVPVQSQQLGECWNTSPGFSQEQCSIGFPFECPSQQCFVPGAGGGTGPGVGTMTCTTAQLNANINGVACTSGNDCCAGTACGPFGAAAGDHCFCAYRLEQCGASSGQNSAPCCPGETCVNMGTFSQCE